MFLFSKSGKNKHISFAPLFLNSTYSFFIFQNSWDIAYEHLDTHNILEFFPLKSLFFFANGFFIDIFFKVSCFSKMNYWMLFLTFCVSLVELSGFYVLFFLLWILCGFIPEPIVFWSLNFPVVVHVGKRYLTYIQISTRRKALFSKKITPTCVGVSQLNHTPPSPFNSFCTNLGTFWLILCAT